MAVAVFPHIEIVLSAASHTLLSSIELAELAKTSRLVSKKRLPLNRACSTDSNSGSGILVSLFPPLDVCFSVLYSENA